jgi:short-subunit dehydrogenase
MNIFIAGASAGLGRSLAQEAALRGHNLLLCASGWRDLAVLASDLRLRFGIEAAYVPGDVCAPEDRLRIVRTVNAWLPLDCILLPVGYSRVDDTGFLDDVSTLHIVNVDFLAEVALITALWERLAIRDRAFLVGFGSIAAIRGRRKNVIYAAAKRSLESYFESLRALAGGSGISVQLYRVGYRKTQQTFGKKLLLPVVSPERVAQMVFRRLGQRQGNTFYPRWWGLLSAVLRNLPWFIYKRFDF